MPEMPTYLKGLSRLARYCKGLNLDLLNADPFSQGEFISDARSKGYFLRPPNDKESREIIKFFEEGGELGHAL
jgi:hypothetical protein